MPRTNYSVSGVSLTGALRGFAEFANVGKKSRRRPPESLSLKPFVYVVWPMPYEVEFNLTNRVDCVDWYRAHPEHLLEKKVSMDRIKNLSRGSETASYRAHNPGSAGSTPAPATNSPGGPVARDRHPVAKQMPTPRGANSPELAVLSGDGKAGEGDQRLACPTASPQNLMRAGSIPGRNETADFASDNVSPAGSIPVPAPFNFRLCGAIGEPAHVRRPAFGLSLRIAGPILSSS